MFSLAIDSSLRGIDIVSLNVADVMIGEQVRERVTIRQMKTKERVTVSLTSNTRMAIADLVKKEDKGFGDPLFTGQK